MTVGACVLPELTQRHHGGIGDAQALDAAHAELRVDDRASSSTPILQVPTWWW